MKENDSIILRGLVAWCEKKRIAVSHCCTSGTIGNFPMLNPVPYRVTPESGPVPAMRFAAGRVPRPAAHPILVRPLRRRDG